MSDPLISINKWSETFENADTRKRERLKWFQTASGCDSSGYLELITANGQEGIMAFGIFAALCQLSATLPKEVRGTFKRSSGEPMSMRQIALLIRVDVCHLSAALQLLASKGVEWVSIEHAKEESADNLPPSADDFPALCKEKEKEKEKEKIQCASSDARIDSKVVSDQFEEFWEAFDDKRGKKPALLRFKKVLKSGADFQAILAGAKRYAISRNQPDPPNPKMAEGWLNDERWTDEIVKPGQVASRPKETWQIENEVKTLKHQLEEIRNNSINKYAPDPERPWEQILKPEPKERADALKQKIKLLQSQMEVAA